MLSVLGVDPGLNGAMARFDLTTGSLAITDMPTWYTQIGRKKRQRVDAYGLLEYFEIAKMSGVDLVMLEAVGGRPKQSASSGFTFGYIVGMIYMACMACKLPIESIHPAAWKKAMAVPGKRESTKAGKTTKEHAGAIVGRADELFPDHKALFRGTHGGYKLDRAEAALLAAYAARFALNSTKLINIRDPEWALAYRNVDTGS